jgi:ribosomal protein L28
VLDYASWKDGVDAVSRYDHILKIVEGQGSRIFSVVFIKKDGSPRTMLVQYAATKTHMLGENAPEHKQRAAATRREQNPNLLNVCSMDAQGFRSINMDTLKQIRGEGRVLWEAL